MVPDAVNRQPVVVLNACDRDCQMELKKLAWIDELGGCKHFDCLVAVDATMNKILARELVNAARKVFHTVQTTQYNPPHMTNWPLAANWAFQWAAWAMFEDGRAWFWFEADCVPVKEGWMDALADEYWKCGKPLMGSIVTGRGHLNGTAIYPHNFPELSPKAMQCTNQAWDWEMTSDIIHLAHNSALMAHCWGIVNGMPSPYDGPPASFTTQEQVDRWIPKGAVVFHRAKFGDLIDRLRERRSAKPKEAISGGGGILKV